MSANGIRTSMNVPTETTSPEKSHAVACHELPSVSQAVVEAPEVFQLMWYDEAKGSVGCCTFVTPYALPVLTEHIGASATVRAGHGTRDHARAAVQLLSGGVPTRTVYGHLGWREVNGELVYFHAGGAIGANGPVSGVEVEVGDALERYVLPTPLWGRSSWTGFGRAWRSSTQRLTP